MSTTTPNTANAATADSDKRNEGDKPKVIRWGIVGVRDVDSFR